MYGQFTDRARKLMQLASKRAKLRQNEYVGTEHILFALLEQEGSFACNVLARLGTDLRKLDDDLKKMCPIGPDDIVFGDQQKLPHTPRTKKVLKYAVEFSRSLNHTYVGTEHLLLGLIKEEEGVAAHVLGMNSVTLEGTQATILSILEEQKKQQNDLSTALQNLKNVIGKPSISDTAAIRYAMAIIYRVNDSSDWMKQLFEAL